MTPNVNLIAAELVAKAKDLSNDSRINAEQIVLNILRPMQDEIVRLRKGNVDGAKFSVTDSVKKITGYSFDGVVVAVFKNTKGENRAVAELVGKNGGGMLHIFSENQLEHRQ